MKKFFLLFSIFSFLYLFLTPNIIFAASEGDCSARFVNGGRSGNSIQITNNCSQGYEPKTARVDSNTNNYSCTCVAVGTPTCSKGGTQCTDDPECSSAPGCGGYFCLGKEAAQNGGRVPGTCTNGATFCRMEGRSCAGNDNNCQSPGGACGEYYCWNIGDRDSKCMRGKPPVTANSTPTPTPQTAVPAGSGTTVNSDEKIDRYTFNAPTYLPKYADRYKVINNALSLLLSIISILSIGFLIWGGIELITSEGDKQKVQGARGRITYAILGLILAFLSFFIVQLIGYVFGLQESGRAILNITL